MKLGRHRWLCEGLNPGLESAVPMADTYRRMLAAWRAHDPIKLLTGDEIVAIVAARNGGTAPKLAIAKEVV